MQYPALEDVYDLSTQDLRNLQQRLRTKPDGHQQLLETIILQIQQRKALQYFAQLCNTDNPYAKKVAAFNQQFLKLAAEEIAKNHNDRSQGIGSYQPSQVTAIGQQKRQDKIKKQQPKTQHKNGGYQSAKQISGQRQQRQHTDTQTRSIQSETQSEAQSDAISTTTTGTGSMSRKTDNQPNSSRISAQVKLNIGNKKTDKAKLKGIQGILARTKVDDDDVVIKRNNMMSPHTGGINPHKKYYIPGESRPTQQITKPNTNPQTKTKKSIQAPQSSQKSIKETNGNRNTKGPKASSTDQSKKIQQVTAKMKQQSKKGVKLPKINQYKDLVEMVKQQQQQKKARANKAQLVQKLPHIQTNNDKSKEEYQNEYNPIKQQLDTKQHNVQNNGQQNRQQQKLQVVQSENKLVNQSKGKIDKNVNVQSKSIKHNSKQQQKQQKSEYIGNCNTNMEISDRKQRKKSQYIMMRKASSVQIIKQQQMEQSLSPNRIQKLNNPISQTQKQDAKMRPNTTDTKNTRNQHLINQDEVIEPKGRLTQSQMTDYQLKQNNQSKEQKKLSMNGNDTNKPPTSHSQCTPNQLKNSNSHINSTQEEKVDYTKKLIQLIQKQQQSQYHFFGANEIRQINNDQSNQTNDNHQTNMTQKQSNNQLNGKNQNANKKCYSQQYWAHIRQQAELKIKRFKQQKEYQQSKQTHNQEKSIDDKYLQDQQKQDENQINSTNQKSPNIDKLKQEQTAFEKQIASKQDQLNKLKKQVMKKTSTKVAQAVAIPKVIRPKPQFDYFSVYPTFNHIFSAMYLKPVAQAITEIPNIMRDIKTLFTTHMQHFSTKTNFKPAIFLPFDGSGAFQLTDPKQLISHAQQTYIDLKVMIERVQMFNQNLHGNFNNGTDDMYYRVVKTKQEVYDIITTSFMRRKGWKELPHGCSLRSSWNLFWSWSKPDIDISKLLVWQKINHFPFNKNLSRKDLLYKNLDFFRKNYKVSINFLPITYNLPKQFSQLSAKFHEQEMLNKDFNYWIMKPIGKSRGRGIKVVSSLSQLNYTDNIVVQKYIADPMLIDGYKFDMRIYVLVTSFHPLQAFVYKQGFARLSTEKYSLDAHSIKNTFVHLTNFAINKNNVASNSNFAGGSKISLKTLKDRVTRMGYSFSNIWTQVHDIIVKSLLGCSVSVPSFPTAFELFGYDIMVDQQCNCHLIQINTSPSLERSYMIDEIVKQNLIDDIIDIVDPPDFDKKQLLDVFNERIQAMTNKKKITAEDDLIGLARILRYKPIRKIGQMPAKMGLFQVVAPCDTSRQLQKLIKVKSGANNPMNID